MEKKYLSFELKGTNSDQDIIEATLNSLDCCDKVFYPPYNRGIIRLKPNKGEFKIKNQFLRY